MEVIVLVGGLGTRLKEVTKDLPKPMVDVQGKPFLYHLINYVSKFNVSKIILATGYKSKLIQDYFGQKFKGISNNLHLNKSKWVLNLFNKLLIDADSKK